MIKILVNIVVLLSHVKGIVARCKANHDRYQELVLETDTSVDKQYAEVRKGNAIAMVIYLLCIFKSMFCSNCEGYS